MEYILTFGEGEYVESYTLDGKRIVTGEKKEIAVSFLSKSNADFVAEKLGCMVSER